MPLPASNAGFPGAGACPERPAGYRPDIGCRHGRLDVIRRYLQAAQRGDWETGFGFFADVIVLHVLGRESLAGEHRGRAAAEGYLQAALARSHGAEVELVDMLASEERVALIVRERFHRPGGAVEIRRANRSPR